MTITPEEVANLAAASDALIEAGDDVVRASNTLMLMLTGSFPLTKKGLENAVRLALDARNAWDNANTAYRAARETLK